MNEMKKQTVFVDFDGVLNTYNDWEDDNELFEPKIGVHKFLYNLSKVYRVYVFTSRPPTIVEKWLIKYNLIDYIVSVTNIKAPAHAYIDDRAIRFDGDYENTIIDLVRFEPHWKVNNDY